MKTLIKNISSLLTINANGARHKIGADMNNIGEIKNGAIFFSDVIEWIGDTESAEKAIESNLIAPEQIIDATDKTIAPGFVDSHSHLVFGGSRAEEFAERLRGVSYQEIAAKGGGIQKTVNATREASFEELLANAKKLALKALSCGTTTIEIKSGYGLDFDSEMKSLKVIQELKKILPMRIIATFLGAHDFPKEYQSKRDEYIDIICNKMIPAVAEENLAEFCDAFVDEGYYTLEQGEKIFETAKKFGMKIKMHADELKDVSAAGLAAKVGSYSADHLLCVSDAGINALKNSGTVATLLPGTAYNLKVQYAPARKIIDAGAICAIATDCNPGSCFMENMQFVLSLAATNMKMSVEEAFTAATINGAAALGISDKIGSLEIGKKADFNIFDAKNYAEIVYHFGGNLLEQAWIDGEKVFSK